MAAQLELTQKPFIELQIDALIQENLVKPKRVNKFIDKLEETLCKIKDIDYDKLINRTFRLPFIGRPNSLNADYPKVSKFEPPEQIHVLGSFRTATAIKRNHYIDIAVEMPEKLFERKDIKNQRYHQKRALYLAQLAHILGSKLGSTLIEKLEFRYYQGDFLKPVLIITPKDQKLKNSSTFQLFVFPPQSCDINIANLHPLHGNISPKWFFGDYPIDSSDSEINEFIAGDADTCLTPFYNSSILFDFELVSNSDLLYEQIGSHSSLVSACMLTKIWLYQRDLHHQFSFIITMFLAYLQTKQLVHPNMSAYQIFKVIVKSLAKSDWTGSGLSFYQDSADKISMFKSTFPVIFLSPSGNINLCYDITDDIYARLQHEAQLSQDILSLNSSETFELLFLKKVDFVNKFDVLVHIPNCTRRLPLKLEYLKKFLDHGVFVPRVYSESILTLARRALTDRVKLIQQNSDHLILDKRWYYKTVPYDPCNENNTFTLGLLLDGEKSLRIIDIGPDAKSPEAEEFTNFWGPKSQLRLQNGTISETVVWHVDSFSQRRAIIKYILTHALKRAEIHNIVVQYTILERCIDLQNVIFSWRDDSSGDAKEAQGDEESTKKKRKLDESAGKPIGVGEETFHRILQAYNEFNKIIRNVEGLEHPINSIQPMSAHLRGSAVFPSLPVGLQSKNKSLKRSRGVTKFPENQFVSTSKILHLEPIEILVTLDNSGKWPNDSEALEAAKMDYLIQLSEALKEKEFSVKLSSEKYLDVLYGQFVFRLLLKTSKDLAALQMVGNKHGIQKKRMQLEVLPRVHAALDQLYREKPAYGLTCRIVKRWICCQLMTDHISDIVLDLMVAHLFLHPFPYTEPESSLCGFRRFLMLIARHDWKQMPLVVNFDKQFKSDEVDKLRQAMLEDRAKFPAIVLCTPYDKELCPWAKDDPNLPKLDLICRLCTKAWQYMNKDILYNLNIVDECKALFRPNFKIFDLLIKIKIDIFQNFFMAIDAPANYVVRGAESNLKHVSAFKVMPIVDLNVVEQYVCKLRSKYDQVALFFYDRYGQRVIGVAMKPDAERLLEGRLDKFIAGIKELGAKMVDSVTVMKEN